jgi:hypothetical protein
MDKKWSTALGLIAISVVGLLGIRQGVEAQDAGCQGTVISLDKAVNGSLDLYITAAATMPETTLRLTSEPDCMVAAADWNLQIEYWDGWAAGTHRILEWKLGAQRSGLFTGDGWTRAAHTDGPELALNTDFWGGVFGGGIGTLSVQVQFTDGTASTLNLPLIIRAENPAPESIQAYLGNLKYQILGYLESKFYNFTGGIPLLNCGDYECASSDGGFGLMQITLCEGSAGTLSSIASKPGYFGSGIPSYRQIWDWKANVDVGISCFQQKLANQCTYLGVGSNEYYFCGYSAYNGSNFYGNLATQVYQETQQGRFRAGWFK